MKKAVEKAKKLDFCYEVHEKLLSKLGDDGSMPLIDIIKLVLYESRMSVKRLRPTLDGCKLSEDDKEDKLMKAGYEMCLSDYDRFIRNKLK